MQSLDIGNGASQVEVGKSYDFQGYVKLQPKANASPQNIYATLQYKLQGTLYDSTFTIIDQWIIIRISGLKNYSTSMLFYWVDGSLHYRRVADASNLLPDNEWHQISSLYLVEGKIKA